MPTKQRDEEDNLFDGASALTHAIRPNLNIHASTRDGLRTPFWSRIRFWSDDLVWRGVIGCVLERERRAVQTSYTVSNRIAGVQGS